MWDKGVHAFPKGVSSKVNVIAQPEFELSNYNVAVQHLSHYATGTVIFAAKLGSKGCLVLLKYPFLIFPFTFIYLIVSASSISRCL